MVTKDSIDDLARIETPLGVLPVWFRSLHGMRVEDILKEAMKGLPHHGLPPPGIEPGFKV